MREESTGAKKARLVDSQCPFQESRRAYVPRQDEGR